MAKSRHFLRVGLTGLLIGCTTQAWHPVDLQLDIAGADLSDTDRVRICIANLGMREVAYGSGRIAFTGLPSDTPLQVTVDALVPASSANTDSGQGHDTGSHGATEDLRLGRAGPIELGLDDTYAMTTWQTCSEACESCQSPGEPEGSKGSNRILGIRFSN